MILLLKKNRIEKFIRDWANEEWNTYKMEKLENYVFFKQICLLYISFEIISVRQKKLVVTIYL